ncbi:MAG: HD domain-containing protein [Spirochaetales bacterium]
MLAILLRLFALKDQFRTGWTLRAVTDPESVADHSWGTALLCMSYATTAGVDSQAALEIALVHDAAEAITGDVPTRVATMNDPVRHREKLRLEREAMDELLEGAPDTFREQIERRWSEYEERVTPEAVFVRDMNLIDMCMQALLYERDGRVKAPAGIGEETPYRGLEEFFATTRPRLSTQIGRDLFAEISAEYARLP